MFRDIPRFYTALAEWLAVFTLLLICRKRMGKRAFILISAAALMIQSSFMILTANAPRGILWVLCMAAAFLLMFSYFIICGEVDVRTALYCCAGGFIMAEFAASFEWQIHVWVDYHRGPAEWEMLLLLVCVYGIVYFAFYRLEKDQLTGAYLKSLTWQETSAALLIAIFTFTFSNLSFIVRSSPFSGQLLTDIFMIRTMVDLGGLAILYAYQLRVGALITEREMLQVQSTLMNQYEQYRQNQESEKMLHILQHDLKHRIEVLRSEKDLSKRNEWLDDMESDLNSWWLPQRTGSPVLDTILSARMRRARSLGIRITCVADGALLSDIHVMDLCTIFGNAMDNAMESVVQIPDEERRLIHLAVTKSQNFVFIQVSNTCESEIRRGEDWSLLTTKADRKNHGYGLKSIRYAVEKYGGTVSFEVKNGWFELRILLPKADAAK